MSYLNVFGLRGFGAVRKGVSTGYVEITGSELDEIKARRKNGTLFSIRQNNRSTGRTTYAAYMLVTSGSRPHGILLAESVDYDVAVEAIHNATQNVRNLSRYIKNSVPRSSLRAAA